MKAQGGHSHTTALGNKRSPVHLHAFIQNVKMWLVVPFSRERIKSCQIKDQHDLQFYL